MANDIQYLSEEEAWDVKQFALHLNNSIMGMAGIFSPSLLNQNLIGLNNRESVVDYDKVIKALENPLTKADTLQIYQEWLEFADMTFKRTMEYYANILSFDLSYVCINANKEDYKTTKYKNDLKIVQSFLDRFNYKAEFRKVMKQILRNEVAFMWLRNNNDAKNTRYTLQFMPQSYCMLTGYWDMGLLYDFDMNYFSRAGVDINGYDPQFKIILKQMYEAKDIQRGLSKYKPDNPFNKRNGTFAYWTQTSPIYIDDNECISGAWAFKLDMANFAIVPYLSALMRDAILNIPIKAMQYDKDVAAARAFLIGEIGMLNSTEPNATQFDPVRLGALMRVVKEAVGKYLSVGAMPAQEVEFYQYEDKNKDMVETQVKSAVGNGASASRVIYATDKMSQEEIRNAILTDYNSMSKVYEQFNNFLNFYVNKLTKKFKFSFTFTGSNYGFEREWRKSGIMQLAQNGIVLNDTAFASAFGYKPQDFQRMLAESSSEGSWMENLSQLQSIFTQSNKSSGTNVNQPNTEYVHTGKRGRPPKAEVTSDSRDYDYINT